MMGECLIEFVFAAGVRLIDQCEEAKQCETEVIRVAVRTQNVLGTLKVGCTRLTLDSHTLQSKLFLPTKSGMCVGAWYIRWFTAAAA